MRWHVQLATTGGAAVAMAVAVLYGSPVIAQQRGDQHPRSSNSNSSMRSSGRAPIRGTFRRRHPREETAARCVSRSACRAAMSTRCRTSTTTSGTDMRRRTTQRFHLATPWAHGRFDRIGPSYRYGVQRFDDHAHRFWIAGRGGFEVASWDWSLAADWCWNCGDDFVIYDDPDHPGWYLVYNVHTGVYVHAQFIGT